MATKKKTKKGLKKPAKAAKKPRKKNVKKSGAKKIATARKGLVAKPAVKPRANVVAKTTPKAPFVKANVKAAKNRRLARTRGKPENVETVEFEATGLGARSAGQSGDLQGLTNRAGADSESVDELLEEGNAFEAEVIKGVEDVPDADEGEIVTREVLEDDVPGEYDDQ
jgi:hypothetical protein